MHRTTPAAADYAGHPASLALSRERPSVAIEPIMVDEPTAAKMLGISPASLRKLRAGGTVPSVKLAGRRLFRVADLREFVDSMDDNAVIPA